MSIEQGDIIDARSISNNLKEVHLFLFDHLSWDNVNDEHLFMLQKKINTYLAYIENGQIYQDNPEYKNKSITINIIAKYPLPENDVVRKFYEKVKSIVQWAGFDLKFEYKKE